MFFDQLDLISLGQLPSTTAADSYVLFLFHCASFCKVQFKKTAKRRLGKPLSVFCEIIL